MRAGSRIDTSLLIALVAAVLAVPGFAAYGLVAGEFRAFAAFGLLPAAVLVALSAALSGFSSPGMERIVKIAWLTMAVLAIAGLVFVVLGSTGIAPINVAETLCAWVLIILAFPSGFAGPVVLGALDWAFPQNALSQDPLLRSLLLWFVSVPAGFCQWFLFVPWLAERGRMRQVSTLRGNR